MTYRVSSCHTSLHTFLHATLSDWRATIDCIEKQVLWFTYRVAHHGLVVKDDVDALTDECLDGIHESGVCAAGRQVTVQQRPSARNN